MSLLASIPFLGKFFAEASDEVAAVEAEAPKKVVTLFHAILAPIEAKEANHPFLLQATLFIDNFVAAHGEAVVTDIDLAAITYLKGKYAWIGVALGQAPAVPGPTSVASPGV